MAEISNVRVGKEHDPINSFVGSISAPDENEPAPHKYETSEYTTRFTRLYDYFRQELSRQASNRYQQGIDADYYDHIQYTEEDAKAYEERGQVPRVYNKIKQSIDWILGTEKRTRVDWKILARRKEGEASAEAKTELLKYLSDANRLAYVRSRAFQDAVKVGVGWLEESVFDNDDGEPMYLGWESWRNMLWDSANPSQDVSDGRYIFRPKWVDIDVACSWFPERTDIIQRSMVDGYSFDSSLDESDEAMDSVEAASHDYAVAYVNGAHKRQRVRLIECWYKVPTRVQKLRSSKHHPFKGEIYDAKNPKHVEAVEQGLVSVAERPHMQVRLAVICKAGMLYDSASPYKHNKFPFTAIWGYRRDRDNLPYGVIRGLRDPQDDFNKRIMKSMAVLSNNKTIMEKGAVDDLNEFAKEVSRPDAVIVKNPNKSLEINVDRDLAPAHMAIAEMDAMMIQEASGVTNENLGRDTNATSGKAIIAKQDQGAMATAELFDNLRLASQISGEKTVVLTEQFYTDEKIIRLIGNKGQVEYKTINDPNLPESEIAADKADFIVSEQDFRDSLRIAAQEQLVDMLTKMPENIAVALLDVVVDGMELPSEQREEIVKRIRKITGQIDPDAKQTPEEQQALQAAQQQAQAQQELMMRDVAAKVALTEAQVNKTNAETQQIGVNMQQAAAANDPAVKEREMQMNAAQAHRKALIDAHTAIEKARMEARTKLRQSEISTLAQASAAELAEQQAAEQV